MKTIQCTRLKTKYLTSSKGTKNNELDQETHRQPSQHCAAQDLKGDTAWISIHNSFSRTITMFKNLLNIFVKSAELGQQQLLYQNTLRVRLKKRVLSQCLPTLPSPREQTQSPRVAWERPSAAAASCHQAADLPSRPHQVHLYLPAESGTLHRSAHRREKRVKHPYHMQKPTRRISLRDEHTRVGTAWAGTQLDS